VTLMQWMYSVRWSLRDVPCPGETELIRMTVPAGAPIPDEVLAKHEFCSGYAVCIDFLSDREIKRWSPERKAAARRRNMERRINKRAPLFAEELIAQELAARPDYFSGK